MLDQAGFAQRYGYCPNIDCPATAYSFWSEDAADEVDFTVEELWKRYARNTYGQAEPDTWDTPDPELRPRELLETCKDAEVKYRWVMLDKNTKFCEYCGTALRSTCIYCNAALKMRNQKFCHACGRRLNRPVEQDETTGKRDAVDS